MALAGRRMDIKLDAASWATMERLAAENRRSLVGQVSYAVDQWLRNAVAGTDGLPDDRGLDVTEDNDDHPFG